MGRSRWGAMILRAARTFCALAVGAHQPVVLPAYPSEPGPTEAFPDTP